MVRAILRSVQNTLVLMSVLLVILAFQRLESFDHRAAPASSLWPHPLPSEPYLPEAGDSAEGDDEGPAIRSQNRLLFGREFRIGLLRFVLPLLKVPGEATRPAMESSSSSSFGRNKLRSSIRSKTGTVPKLHPAKIAYVVIIESCTSETIDAASVLRHSLSNTLHHELYAFAMMDESNARCSALLKGFHLVTPKTIDPNLDESCIHANTWSLLLAHRLDADLVVHVALPSVAISLQANAADSSAASLRIMADDDDSGKQRKGALLANHTVLKVRPQGIEATSKVIKAIAAQCEAHDHDEMTVVNDTTLLSSLSSWEPSSSCRKRVCHISDSVSIATLVDCPRYEKSNDKDENECGGLQAKWLRVKESIPPNR